MAIGDVVITSRHGVNDDEKLALRNMDYARVLGWLSEVVLDVCLQPRVLELTRHVFGAFVQSQGGRLLRARIQLFAGSCLWIAAKAVGAEERLTAEEVLRAMCNRHTRYELFRAERHVLRALGWTVGISTVSSAFWTADVDDWALRAAHVLLHVTHTPYTEAVPPETIHALAAEIRARGARDVIGERAELCAAITEVNIFDRGYRTYMIPQPDVEMLEL